MSRLTIYLPDDIATRATEAAKAQRISLSRWIADQVVRHLDDTWPEGVLNAAGAVPDFPSLREIRNGYGGEARPGRQEESR